MTEDSQAPTANRMLGSQLVNKSILCNSQPQTTITTSASKQQQPAHKGQQQQRHAPADNNSVDNGKPSSPPARDAAATLQAHQQPNTTAPSPSTSPSKSPQNQTHPPKPSATQIPKSKKSMELIKQANISAIINEGASGGSQQQQVAATACSSAKEMQLLTKEAQDLKAKIRKLQLEIDEKNEIINILKDELETLREQNDKYHRDSIQLIKDSKRVKFLQDENDFLQDKVGQVEILELEIKRLKERLSETEFFKLRVSELEEDLNKSREESNQFEDNWRQAETKLCRVAELEAELNKWKSFSHELELEKNAIQSKLLESIDHEAKLDSDNKKVEDEVRRLRDLIKSYEEQRDEEQASNSLIMSVADLKQLDNEHQQRSNDSRLLIETGTNTVLNDVQEIGQQTDASGTAEKSCETDHVDIVELKQQQDDEHNLQALNNENEALKEELKRQEIRLNDLADSNKQIFNELDGNRKLISDLRQDLACEKSLTQKLTTQLTSFTKQIKSLDKQYFPIHDTATTTTTTVLKQQIDSDQQQQQRSHNQLKSINDTDRKQKSTHSTAIATSNTSSLTPTRAKEESADILRGAATKANISQNIDSPVNCLKEGLPADESQQEQLAKKQNAATKLSVTSTPNNNFTGRLDKELNLESNGVEDEENENNCLINNNLTKVPTPVKSSRSSERDNKSSNFVRNSLPSKSVNFGHSKSSPYLDRIRASVTATAKTSSSNCSASSFNEQAKQNINTEQVIGGSIEQQPGFVLNCMLNHHHSDRCFAKVERPARVQVSQPTPASTIHTNVQQQHGHHYHQQQVHHQAHHQPARAVGDSPSRQLNALIDPVANEQLLMSMLQQQIAAQQQPGLPSSQQLTEQQIAHLNSLQRQHYYHHLHQLHQMHHLHQLHHLHHKCQQQRQQQQQQQHRNHQVLQLQKSDSNVIPDLRTNMVGSQFYAPTYDQVYASMAANNNNDHQLIEHRIQRQNGTRLVNNDSDPGVNTVRQQQQEYKRSSPQRTVQASSAYHQMSSTKLAQIDELTNSLSTGFDPHEVVKKTNNHVSKLQQYSQQQSPPNQPPKASTMQRTNSASNASSQQRQQQSSPTSSSPTSSRTSSNISPSSEASSSSSTSSTNSLSTSVPLTRSALRHTATDLGRCQYSVERELINSTPLTATLSRVGSCRGVPSNHHMAGQQQTAPREVNSMMRNPVQSQQPPMRTSKILNIGSQQQQQANAGATAIDASHLTALCKEMKKAPNGVSNIVDNFNRPMTNSMANTKLNDNLAFSSLRVPKKSSSGSNLNTSLIAAAAAASNGRSTNSRVSSASSSPDKARLIKTANTSLPTGKSSNIGSSNSNNNGHSSVWYEYGCI